MRHTITALFAIGLTIAAQAYPLVSTDPNDVQQNVWNTNLAQAKAKAKTLGRPTLLVMLDTVNCGYSKSWVANIADTPQWQSFLQENPMVLVFEDKTKMDSTTWYSLIAPYRDSAGYFYFPTVVMFRPDGTFADQFLARTALGTSPGFYNRVRQTTDQYPNTGTPPVTQSGTIGFSQPTVSVSEGAASVSVSVNRLGGTAGAQTYSYTTEQGTALEGVNYASTGETVVWTDGDATAKTITVPLINDNQWTSPTTRTFSIRLSRLSGTATLGTSLLTVTINEVTPNPTRVPPAFVSPTPTSGSTVSAVLNSAVTLQTSATGSAPIAYSATGLPAGLSINTGTGLISGMPTVAGNSIVTVKASNSKGTATTSFTLRVASQASIAVGTYRGSFFDPDQQTVRGTLALSANTYGAITAQAVLDGSTYTFTGKWQAGTASTAELQASSGGGILSIQVDEFGILTGTLGEAALFGRRVNLSGVGEFAGYYTSILSATAVTPNSDEVNNQPEGSGYVTFTVSSLGAVKYTGVLADGTPFSGSSTILTYSGTELIELGYTDVADDQQYATFPIYTPLYMRRGVIAAQIWIDGSVTVSPNDNKVFLAGSQWVYPGKSATATADGFIVTLDDGAFTEIGAAFVKPANLAEAFDGTSFQTECGAVPVLPSGLSIKLQYGNTLKATLTASTTTGLISGKFLYSPDSGATPYLVNYSGVLVPSLGIGAGYYLAPDNSVTGYSVKRSKQVVIAP